MMQGANLAIDSDASGAGTCLDMLARIQAHFFQEILDLKLGRQLVEVGAKAKPRYLGAGMLNSRCYHSGYELSPFTEKCQRNGAMLSLLRVHGAHSELPALKESQNM